MMVSMEIQSNSWRSLPSTIKLSVGLLWFHVALALYLGFGPINPLVSAAILIVAALFGVFAIGLTKGKRWAWFGAMGLLTASVLFLFRSWLLAAAPAGLTLIILLTPSARAHATSSGE
jgi:hypothetical protein